MTIFKQRATSEIQHLSINKERISDASTAYSMMVFPLTLKQMQKQTLRIGLLANYSWLCLIKGFVIMTLHHGMFSPPQSFFFRKIFKGGFFIFDWEYLGIQWIPWIPLSAAPASHFCNFFQTDLTCPCIFESSNCVVCFGIR